MGTLRFAHPTLLEGIAVRECPSAKELFDQWLRCFGVGDRKPNGSSYPRLRWRVDGVIHSRQLSVEVVVITDDPLRFKFGDVNFRVDLGAERLLAAERGEEKIAVEVKSFLNPSAITDFYAALGQFLSYRIALESVEPHRRLYLAVPVDVYQTFFQLEFTQTAVERYQVLVIVYDPVDEVIVQWTR